MPGPKKVSRYGVEFKLNAVAMSHAPGVQVKDVADSLCVHPFMLSKWRKQVRDGILVGRAEVPGYPAASRYCDHSRSENPLSFCPPMVVNGKEPSPASRSSAAKSSGVLTVRSVKGMPRDLSKERPASQGPQGVDVYRVTG